MCAKECGDRDGVHCCENLSKGLARACSIDRAGSRVASERPRRATSKNAQGLAGASILLFGFVVVSAAFLTIKEKTTKDDIENFDTKPRLPTLAELDSGEVAIGASAIPEDLGGTNRRAKRENRKLAKKGPMAPGDAARF